MSGGTQEPNTAPGNDEIYLGLETVKLMGNDALISVSSHPESNSRVEAEKINTNVYIKNKRIW